jgi:hypothetical protein
MDGSDDSAPFGSLDATIAEIMLLATAAVTRS